MIQSDSVHCRAVQLFNRADCKIAGASSLRRRRSKAAGAHTRRASELRRLSAVIAIQRGTVLQSRRARPRVNTGYAAHFCDIPNSNIHPSGRFKCLCHPHVCWQYREVVACVSGAIGGVHSAFQRCSEYLKACIRR